MPPRTSNRRTASAAKKVSESPQAKKSTLKSKQQASPLSVAEEIKISDSKVQSLNSTEENKDQESAPSNSSEEKEIAQEEEELAMEIQDSEKEIRQDGEVLMRNASEVEEVLSIGDEEKVVIKEEVSVTTVVIKETKVIETVEDKNPDSVSEEFPGSNAVDVEEEAEEMNGMESDNGGDSMDTDQGDKQDLVEEEEVAAAEIEDTKGSGDGNDTLGVNGKEEGEKSGSDEEDNEEDEDPSECMHAPLTDKKKQKDFEIFVGGLDKEAVEEDLIKVFGKFGEIQTARIVRHPTTQKSKGFAFIRYATVEQAKKALAELKDGTEVRGKRVGISPSQDNGTLYVGNICKAWTKEHVLESLRSFGIEQIEEMRLPDDPKNEGKIKGFAFLEFSTHSDAMVAFQRLRKSDVVFGRDISAKVAFAQSPLHPSEEALSQVKTVYIEGLTDSWDEEKVKELCKQYGEIEKVQLSRNLVTKRKDFGFVVFKSRESAVACVEGINTAQIGEGDIKVKANLAKPQNKGRQKQGARGGFKVKEGEVTDEAGPSKLKGHAKFKGAEGKGKVFPKLKSAKGGKPYKPQRIVTEGQGTGVPSSSERTIHQRKERSEKGGKRGWRDTDTGYNMQSSKKPRGIMRSRPSNGFGNERNNSRFGKAKRNYGAASATHGNPYAQGYAAPTSSYQGHAYGAVSGSKRHYSDMEPHAGFLEPATVKQGQAPYGYGLRRADQYDGQGSSGAAYGGGSLLPPSNVPAYSSYAGYQGGGGSYPISGAYPPRQTYY